MGWAVLLRFMVQNLYEEALLSPLPKAGLGSNFSHPWVGQAERLACRERQPDALLRAEARTHFATRGRMTERRKSVLRLPGLRCR